MSVGVRKVGSVSRWPPCADDASASSGRAQARCRMQPGAGRPRWLWTVTGRWTTFRALRMTTKSGAKRSPQPLDKPFGFAHSAHSHYYELPFFDFSEQSRAIATSLWNQPGSGSPAGRPAGPPQIRTCRFPASGSSKSSFARRTIDGRCAEREAEIASRSVPSHATRDAAATGAGAPATTT